ncbi:beta-lactamase-like protein [Gorgonomyces haynaldii]|nr:beta-lactamase-like protein [Gorgonomyces haynaldii]
MKYHISIISTNSKVTQCCYALHIGASKYLFNCPESTQRILNEQNVNWRGYRAIFLNRTQWPYVGGLPGFLLTLSAFNSNSLTLVGSGLYKFLGSLRHFMSQNSVPYDVQIQTDYKDENIVVKSIQLQSDIQDLEYKRIVDAWMGKYTNEKPSIQRTRRMSFKKSENVRSLMAFCVTGPDVPGTFDKQAAVKLGLKPGPLYKQLLEGKPVENPDGITIYPQQCVGPSKSGRKLVILDCPSTDDIPSVLVNQELFESIQASHLLLFSCGPHVLQHNEMSAYLSQFKCQVIVSAPDAGKKHSFFQSSDDLIKRCNKIDPDLFPILPTLEDYPEGVFLNQQPMMSFQLEPKLELTTKECPKPQPVVPMTDRMPKDDIHIVPLGTASSTPGKHRNVSSILLQQPGSSILLDCGEGTLLQLYRYFGSLEMLKTLEIVYVSHLHADHHLGLISILKERSNWTSKPLVIVGPPFMERFLNEASTYEDLAYEFRNLKHYTLDPLVLDHFKLQAVPVVHSEDSFAVIVDMYGKRIVYSGDCRPSQRLAQTALNSDLLIHEATFDDELQKDAQKKNHSTISEALSVGQLYTN